MASDGDDRDSLSGEDLDESRQIEDEDQDGDSDFDAGSSAKKVQKARKKSEKPKIVKNLARKRRNERLIVIYLTMKVIQGRMKKTILLLQRPNLKGVQRSQSNLLQHPHLHLPMMKHLR